MKKAIQRCSFVVLVVFVCFAFITQGYGAINWWGDVQPPDPSTWTSSTYAYIGKDSDGGTSVTEGDEIEAGGAYLGYNAGISGIATIDTGSIWWCIDNLYVGYSGQGTLDISNGGNVSYDKDGYIGYKSGSRGQVSVDGEGSSWNCGCLLWVGYEGQGTLEVTNGGSVICFVAAVIGEGDGTGTVSVDGEGSSLTCSGDAYGVLVVGAGGQGMLNISNGGNVNVEWETDVAWWEGGTGQINFNNGTLTTGQLLAASADLTGTGEINTYGIVSDIDLVFDSTHGTNQTIILDSLPGQNITINLSQDSSHCLGVGYASEGTLTIKDGVSVGSRYGYLGYKSGSVGQATVDGAGSSWSCSSDLYVGYFGQGTLEISNGGSVEVGETLQVGSNGILDIDSSSSVNVGGNIVFRQNSTLTAQEGVEIHMSGANFQNESTNSANLAGLSNLTLIFEGGSEIVDNLEVAGKDDGAILSAFGVDNFLIGTLQLGGGAAGRIKLVDEYDNQPGWSGSEALYVSNLIMNAGATIDLNGLNLYYLNGGAPKQFFNGDSNLDGLVDDSDLSIVLSEWGETVPPGNPRADLSGDLFVDDADLSILLSDWGKGTPSAHGQSIPEPATLILLLAGLGLGGIRRRK